MTRLPIAVATPLYNRAELLDLTRSELRRDLLRIGIAIVATGDAHTAYHRRGDRDRPAHHRSRRALPALRAAYRFVLAQTRLYHRGDIR